MSHMCWQRTHVHFISIQQHTYALLCNNLSSYIYLYWHTITYAVSYNLVKGIKTIKIFRTHYVYTQRNILIIILMCGTVIKVSQTSVQFLHEFPNNDKKIRNQNIQYRFFFKKKQVLSIWKQKNLRRVGKLIF